MTTSSLFVPLLQLQHSAHNQADLSHKNEAGVANERKHEHK